MWTIIGNGTIEPRAIEGQERDPEVAGDVAADRTGGPRRARVAVRRRVSEWCGERLMELGDRLLHHPATFAPAMGA